LEERKPCWRAAGWRPGSRRSWVPDREGFELLPARWSRIVQTATRTALEKALWVALGTMDRKTAQRPNNVLHKVAAAVSGGVGGAFGLAALPVELSISTTIMLRSIADIARSQGEDLKTTPARLACLEVFALGGKSSKDDTSESSYFIVRAALAKAVSEAAEYIAERGLAEEAAPALVRLLATISGRFGIVVSEKAAAMAIPAIGAAGGALINALFMDHFQNMAAGHFTVRKLERKYGATLVRAAYEQSPRREPGGQPA